MGPGDEEETDLAGAGRSRRARVRGRIAAVQARATGTVDRVQAERGRHGSVDAIFEIVDRDAEIGGGMIAGALAYRLFIWLLPLALVAVAGLGIAASEAGDSPTQAARSLGMAGIASSSVAGAAKSHARWYALLIGLPILLWATRSLARALVVSHRLVWTEVRGSVPRVTIKATLLLLALLVAFFSVAAVGSFVRSRSSLDGLLLTLFILAPYGALWLLVSMRLPRRGATWLALLPGALLFAVGAELLNAVSVYFIVPEAESKQGTYGALGVAAALLLGLFFLGRLVVATAVVNATLWERRHRSE